MLFRSVGQARQLSNAPNFDELVNSWHASIGKSVLESWGFAGEIAEAVAGQADYERRSKNGADLTDVTMVSILLADHLGRAGQEFEVPEDIVSFKSVGLSKDDCTAVLTHAEYQLGSLHDALGC